MPRQKINRGWMTWGAVVVLALLVAGLVSPTPVQAAPAGSGYVSEGRTAVAVNGMGDALIWPLFTVENTNTLIAVTNTSIRLSGGDAVASTCAGTDCLGFPSIQMGDNSIGQWTLVRFHFRRDTDSFDIKDFSVCLSPGDVWTATLTKVGSETRLASSDLSSINFETTGSPGVSGLNEALVGNPLRGYIEAVAVDTGTSKTLGCDGVAGGLGSGGNVKNSPNAFVRSLMGEVFYVSTGTGLANGVNATAIVNLQEIHQTDQIVTDSIRSTVCPTADCSTYNSNQKRTFFALTHPGEFATVGSLVSRWILDTTAGFDTQMVVTFPLGSLSLKIATDLDTGYAGSTSDVAFDFSIPSVMTLYLRDDEEHRSNSPRFVTMGKEVNIINLSTEVAANPSLVPSGAKGGWLHLLIDNDQNEWVDAVAGQACVVAQANGGCNIADRRPLFMPAMLPIVGFTNLTSSVSPTAKLSALLPWKWMPPANDFHCGGNSDIHGEFGRCRGHGFTFP